MAWKELTKEKLEETKRHFAEEGYVMQWYAMASEVLLTTLGPDWWKTNCTTASTSPDPFLKTDGDSEHERYTHQHRIIKLGHMLYALHHVQGYDTFISSLAHRNLESTYFELSVANMLFENGYSIEFVAESGKKMEDYDLRARTDNVELYVEAKSRRDGSVLDRKTLSNTLKKARRQLPNTGPGVIFVSIPEQWTRELTAEDVIGTCVKAFLSSAGRVNYVVLVWSTLLNCKGGKAAALVIREYRNNNPRRPVPIQRVVKPITIPEILDLYNQVFTPSFW